MWHTYSYATQYISTDLMVDLGGRLKCKHLELRLRVDLDERLKC